MRNKSRTGHLYDWPTPVGSSSAIEAPDCHPCYAATERCCYDFSVNRATDFYRTRGD
jgi:hypothetical protein